MKKWELIVECADGERVKVFHRRVLDDNDTDKIQVARRSAEELLGREVLSAEPCIYRYWDNKKWIREKGSYGSGCVAAVLEDNSPLCYVDGYITEAGPFA